MDKGGKSLWEEHGENPRSCENKELSAKIVDLFETSDKTYGSPRIHED
jgi:hypothetical protein